MWNRTLNEQIVYINYLPERNNFVAGFFFLPFFLPSTISVGRAIICSPASRVFDPWEVQCHKYNSLLSASGKAAKHKLVSPDEQHACFVWVQTVIPPKWNWSVNVVCCLIVTLTVFHVFVLFCFVCVCLQIARSSRPPRVRRCPRVDDTLLSLRKAEKLRTFVRRIEIWVKCVWVLSGDSLGNYCC